MVLPRFLSKSGFPYIKCGHRAYQRAFEKKKPFLIIQHPNLGSALGLTMGDLATLRRPGRQVPQADPQPPRTKKGPAAAPPRGHHLFVGSLRIWLRDSDPSPHALVQLGSGSRVDGLALDDITTTRRVRETSSDRADSLLSLGPRGGPGTRKGRA